MIYGKRYLQFNNLVFDGYDMIRDFDEDISFKENLQSYSYGHGSYYPLKNRYLYAESRTATMTITLHLKKIPCEYRLFYVRFAEEELLKPGKLWAIKNNEIIWANAYVKNLTPIYSDRQEYVEWDVEFTIPEGIWHKADKLRTFVVPYDVCTFMECRGYREPDPCPALCNDEDVDCCESCLTRKGRDIVLENEACYCCCSDGLSPDMALCYHTDEIQDFYGCETPFQLVYDCISAEKFTRERFLGQKICADVCENIIAGRFYSDTDLPTKDVTIIIDGIMNSPHITINGNTNIIVGKYEGTLIVKSNGDVIYKTECCEQTLDPSAWQIPKGNDFGWEILPRGNSISVNLNSCCADEHLNCVYVQAQGITA